MSEVLVRGLPASQGIAIGPARVYQVADAALPTREPGAFEDEWGLFQRALAAAAEDLVDLQSRVSQRAGSQDASIFGAQRMMLQDPLLTGNVRDQLTRGATAEQAVSQATWQIADQLAGMADPLFASRAADVRDVGRRLVRILVGGPAPDAAQSREPSIIVAEDLTPSDTACLDPDRTLGFCTVSGGITSHTAILARSLGLPAVVGVGEGFLAQVQDGVNLILDGTEGTVWVAPSAPRVADYRKRAVDWRTRQEELKVRADRKATTTDGRTFEVAANVGDALTARKAVDAGADGIGLLRTEFLFLEAVAPPSEDEQRRAYAEIFDLMGNRPVIVRTLDVGGDKPPPFLSFPREPNPFLGWRAIRISLDRTDLFLTQVRAILRAGTGRDVCIMLPMITGVDEVRRARELLNQAAADLHVQPLPLGIMVETPAAALLVDDLARLADFFSLGTNDLTQYTLAVDRGNAQVAAQYQPLHPAVLRLVRSAVEAAHGAGRWIGVCGELAGMRQAIPLLVGLGVDELSMAPALIPEAKALISRLEAAASRAFAQDVLSLPTAADVEARVDRFLDELG